MGRDSADEGRGSLSVSRGALSRRASPGPRARLAAMAFWQQLRTLYDPEAADSLARDVLSTYRETAIAAGEPYYSRRYDNLLDGTEDGHSVGSTGGEAPAECPYVAAKRLSWDPSRPGGGTLGPFTDALRPTKQGSSPSVWHLPMAFCTIMDAPRDPGRRSPFRTRWQARPRTSWPSGQRDDPRRNDARRSPLAQLRPGPSGWAEVGDSVADPELARGGHGGADEALAVTKHRLEHVEVPLDAPGLAGPGAVPQSRDRRGPPARTLSAVASPHGSSVGRTIRSF